MDVNHNSVNVITGNNGRRKLKLFSLSVVVLCPNHFSSVNSIEKTPVYFQWQNNLRICFPENLKNTKMLHGIRVFKWFIDSSRNKTDCLSGNQTSDMGFYFILSACFFHFILWIRPTSRQWEGEPVDINYMLKSYSQLNCVIWLLVIVIQSLSFPTILSTQLLSARQVLPWSSCPHPSQTAQTRTRFCNCLHGLTQSISSLCGWLTSKTYNYTQSTLPSPAPNSSWYFLSV